MDKVQKKRFRTIGHTLNPVVTIAGNGLSDSVVAELNRALNDHELIKIRINAEDRADRDATLSQLLDTASCELVQKIGNVALIYRAAKKPNPALSNLLRTGVL